MQPEGFGAISGLFICIYVVLMGGMVAGWVVFLVSVWRIMKAHESIAISLQERAAKEPGYNQQV